MRIICPSCDTSYTVPVDKIGANGRTVRCARCGTIWQAKAVEEEAQAPATRSFRAETAETHPPFPAAAAPVEPEAEKPATDEPQETFAAVNEAVPDFEPAATADPPDARLAPAPADSFKTDEIAGPGPGPVAPPPDRAAPGEAGDGGSAARTPKARDVESAAQRRKIPVKKKAETRFKLPKLSVGVPAETVRSYAGMALFAVAVSLPVWATVFRVQVVSTVPETAGLFQAIGLDVNLRGLVFEKLETLHELEDGQQVLVVEGIITNVTGQARQLPSVRLSLRDDDASEIYAWSVDPKATSVAAGGNVRFRTKLAAPPDEARDVMVRFTERRNRQALLP